jgi:hypothetical protein
MLNARNLPAISASLVPFNMLTNTGKAALEVPA